MRGEPAVADRPAERIEALSLPSDPAHDRVRKTARALDELDALESHRAQHGLDGGRVRAPPVRRVPVHLVAGVEGRGGPPCVDQVDVRVHDQLPARHARHPLEREQRIAHVVEDAEEEDEVEDARPSAARGRARRSSATRRASRAPRARARTRPCFPSRRPPTRTSRSRARARRRAARPRTRRTRPRRPRRARSFPSGRQGCPCGRAARASRPSPGLRRRCRDRSCGTS